MTRLFFAVSIDRIYVSAQRIHMTPRKHVAVRLSDDEHQALVTFAEERGFHFTDLLRELGKTLPAQQALLLAALEEIRGQFTRGEVSCMLDVNNGVYLTAGLIGQHTAMNVADSPEMDEKWGVETRSLARRIHALTATQRVAIELWTASMWSRHEENDHWEKQITWLSTKPTDDVA